MIMCNACGMNHFDDDDIDYDDEELLASLGIDGSNDFSNLSLALSHQQANQNSQNISPVFVTVDTDKMDKTGVSLN